VVTATVIGKIFGTVLAGILLDRMSTRVVLIGAPLAACIAALFAAGVPWFSMMLVLSWCIGAADSLWATAREFAAIDVAKRSQRGRLIRSMHGTHNLGAALAPFIGGSLTEVFSFKAAFIGYAVFCATLVNQSQRIMVQSMLPLYAGAYLGLSPSQVGMLFSISGMVVFAMIIPAGFIMDRVGRKWCTVPSTGVPAFISLLIPLTDGFIQLAVLVGIAGFAQGLSLGSLATSTYDVVRVHVRGRLQALRRTIAELGSGLATLLAVVGKETLIMRD
jgi:MFS family permease